MDVDESVEIWNECLVWLTELNIFKSNHPAHAPSATWEDLARNLRNGVKLCKLLKIIDPNIIDMDQVCTVTANSKLQCIRNIELFLRQCETKLYIGRNNLFLAEDLFNMENYGTVWNLLSEISHHDKVVVKGVRPFPERKNEYANVENEEYASASFSRKQDPEQNEYGIYDMDENWNNQYDNDDIFLSLTQYLDASLCQLRDIPIEMFNVNVKSSSAHLELLATEKIYAEGLFKMDIYVKRILVEMIGEATADQLIYKFKDLRDLHTKIYESLLYSVPNNLVVIEEVFVELEQELLRVYSDYCQQYKKNLEFFIKFTNKNTDVAKKIREIEETHLARRSLKDFLIHPVQRITKYHLLVQALVSSIENEPSSANNNPMVMKSLRNAVTKLHQIDLFINAAVGDADYMISFKDTYFENFKDLPPEVRDFNCGRLQLEEALSFTPDEKKLKQESGYIFIFEEGVLLCKSLPKNKWPFFQTKGSKNLKKPLKFMKLLPVATIDYHALEDMSQFVITNTATHQRIPCFVRNEHIRKDIENAVNNICAGYHHRTTSMHKFSLTTITFDSEHSFTCDICKTHLTGAYCQGYQCQNCRFVSHGICVYSCKKNNNGYRTSFNDYECFFSPFDAIREDSLNSTWWKGTCSKQEAAKMLNNCGPGSFLVRWSETQISPVLTLVDQYRKLRHLVINFDDGQFYLLKKHPGIVFRSLPALIVNYSTNSLKNVVDKLNVKLLYTP